jgi:hypothetical protein
MLMTRGAHIMGVQVVQAARDVQRDVLPAVVPPQLAGQVAGQRRPQIATLKTARARVRI